MKFTETSLAGAYIIELEKLEDDRGFFARNWDANEFEKLGMNTKFVQASMSYTKKRGTLRGMHFQKAPFGENRLINVTKGKIYDVIIDLRKHSPTYKKWFGIEFSAESYIGLYIPDGFAHGFVTLTNDVEVQYMMTTFYKKEAQAGVLYNDPAFGINWPLAPVVISRRDANFSKFI